MSNIFHSHIVMQDELRADETIMHISRRHVVILLLKLLLPFAILAGSLGVVWYRMSDTLANQRLDIINGPLILLALVMALVIMYLYVDWKRDQIVLTNQRIIYNIERPLVRRIQEQLPINDIHQVEAITDSYPEHWLKFGTIEVQSAAFARSMIFRGVSNPQALQDRVMQLIHNIKQDESEEADFDDMINRRIYQNEPQQKHAHPAVRHMYRPHMLHWLFAENPHYDDQEDSYTWHPHWFFLVKELSRPVAFAVVVLAAIFAGVEFEIVSGIWTGIFLLITGLIFTLWAAWEIEDHRNDRYILTPSQVIDIEKEPFGPENQSSASLDSIQNITYKTTLYSRLLGYGDVSLELTGSGDQLTFYDIPHPRDVVAAIDSYQEAFNKNQKERNLEDTLKLLTSYHTMQQQQADAAGPAAAPASATHGNGSTPQQQLAEKQADDRPENADALLQHLLHQQPSSSEAQRQREA
jgi:hypothetical protein